MSVLLEKLGELMRGVSLSVVLRYAFLQLPAVLVILLLFSGVEHFFPIPPDLKWIVLLLWIIKDVILFPFVWRSYDSRAKSSVASIVGRIGTAQEKLDPRGYVRVGIELWRAVAVPMEAKEGIEKGQTVLVQDVRGMELLVSPMEEEQGAN